MSKGSLSVLSAALGDYEIRFDKDDPADVERAKSTIKDLIARNYIIMAEVDGQWTKVLDFDPEKLVYKVAETPTSVKEAPLKDTTATAVAPVAGG